MDFSLPADKRLLHDAAAVAAAVIKEHTTHRPT